ncbi:bicyclomycin resistance protein [Microbacterium barkeri]|uniref:Bicyclomycin resistance protein n=1 Tax=Microbacterium barkeri TaxID=33917 RepID=A0A9W6H4R6_9MICO|nr:extracellular solute-binding protein [Microbacterium barkeri]MDI6944595.1 extracellular solute-binding protein [Microbacterium barkeri]MDR6877190.1 multiple sugar transport system substrate-binding protein [Microbacterium barkeri]GLJ62611.1 bicyclomycin resistance protein [Microbacterium barkeri]
MKTQRYLSAVAASVLAIVVFSGCSSGAAEDEDGVVRLTFRQFDPADQVEGLVEAVDSWNADHPDIQVDLETVTPNNPQQFAREANSGSGPDVIHMALADVAFLAQPRVLLPLDDLMSSEPLDGADQLLATEMTVIDDTTWGVPWTADTMALVYRPDVLADAGIDATPETWEDFQQVAEDITTGSDGAVSGFCFAAGAQQPAAQWFAINYYLWNHDQYLIENEGGQWQAGVSEDELAAAIDYFDAFFESGTTPASMQALTDYADPAIATALQDGTCAMTYMPPAAFRTVEEQVDAELATAPMPGGLVDGSTHLGGRALGINANSAHPEEAWAFIEYLMSSDTFATYSQYPASAQTLTELDVDPAEQGFVDQLPHSVPFAKYIGAPITTASLQELVNQQFSAVYSGQSDSETAARAILDTIEQGLQG